MLTVVLVGLGLWAFWVEPAWITVRYVSLQIPQWHAEHQDMRIAVLTDLHVGAPHLGVEKLKQVVARTNAEQPDLIVLLGDFVIDGVVGGKFVEPEAIAEVLKGLRATHGTVAVLGNHDWYNDGVRVGGTLQKAGITVLENEALRIERNNRSMWLIGLADLWTRRPDITGSLQQVSNNDPVILLTHNPDVFPDVPARIALTLAGHTHGGQVCLPLVGRPVVPSKFGQRYAMGHVVEDGRHLFVSGGVGTSIIPVRFRVPPEIVLMTLRQK
ncbi:MAG TPA: metallophosphoesterase [Pyrinomonadaceae bacterium]|nr:metallophosphoesterase [Pyrinomonadaceae bacterium]